MSVNAGPRLDRLPITRFHWRMLMLIGLGGLFDSFDIYLGGSVLAQLTKSGQSTLTLNALFISGTFAGMTIGAWAAGVLGDRYGRRFTYQTNLLVFGLASVAAALAPSITWLIAFRFVMGLGLGAELVAATGMLSEFVPPERRGRWYALMSCLINCGMFLQTVLSYALIPVLGWRAMFAVAAVGALGLWYARKAMPESPRWLESRGQDAAAERILKAIESDVQRERGAPLPPVPTYRATVHTTPTPFRRLFERDLLPRTIVATAICVGVNTVAFSFITWLPTFFVREGLSVASSLGFITFMAAGGPIGALVGFLLADRLGRRNGILLAAPIAAALAMIYPFFTAPAAIVGVGFLLFTCIYMLFTFAYYGYMGEIFPTDVRLRGIGFAHTIGRVVTIVTPFLVAFIYSNYGIQGVIALVVASLALIFFTVLGLGVETRDRSLEQLAPDGGAAVLQTAAANS